MHEKGIKRRLLVASTHYKSRDLCLVLVWVLLAQFQYENSVVFLQISVAIDLHEEPTFIPHGIIANSITQPFRVVLYYMESSFMGSSRNIITYFVGHRRHSTMQCG